MNQLTPAIDTRISLPTKYGVAEFVTFNQLADEREHFALVFAGRQEGPVVVRVHSECMTGDLFGSEKCDCGDQLDEALDLLSKSGGVLVYLRQEGRGIGLKQKLKAYHLQNAGADTFAANRALGFADDLRSYDVAAEMLAALEIRNIILLTNNPEKANALIQSGIQIHEVRPTGVFMKAHNRKYLMAKKEMAGHRIDIRLHDWPTRFFAQMNREVQPCR